MDLKELARRQLDRIAALKTQTEQLLGGHQAKIEELLRTLDQLKTEESEWMVALVGSVQVEETEE